MPNNCQILSKKLEGHLRYIDQTRKSIERLFHQNVIKKKDLELVYKGLFLDAVTSFELFFEQLFIGLLTKNLTHSSRSVNPRVMFKSRKVCREVILGERSYVDWIPYNFTEKRAKSYFTNGLPFTFLDKTEKDNIQDIQTIRNAIAHSSNYAIKKFEREVLSGVSLPRRESTPVGYLRHVFISAPPQTRYEKHIIDIALIARKLTGL